MKIQSLLSSRRAIHILLVVLFVATLGTLIFFGPKKYENANRVYHQSQWNEYAPEIDRAVAAEQATQPVRLEHIYGGVVPHHIPTTIPRLVEFYSRLKQTQTVKNFIVIGPDHTDAGLAPVTVSAANFITAYGEVEPIRGLADKLQDAQLAHIEESPFPPEHSIGSQMLIISKIFPEARVTPIILRSDTTKDHAQALGKMLATVLDEETVLIASVDFSHYLSTEQAFPIDQISGEVIKNLDLDALPLVKADSGKSMGVFIQSMKEKSAFDTDGFEIVNTNDFMQNSDYTTGYVFGYWGIGLDGSAGGSSGRASDEATAVATAAELLFVGDIMLSRDIDRLMKKNNDWNYPFLRTADVLKEADLTFGNLEGPISNNGTKVGSIFSFEADPASVSGLLYAGFDVLSIANNHIWDYGVEAFEDTRTILKNNGIDYVGGGSSFEEAHRPLVKQVKGTNIAFLGYTNLLPSSLGAKSATPAVAFPEEEQLIADVQAAEALADIVVVTFHWGDEYQKIHNSYQERLAHIAVDAGADLIVGHHPHVVQDMEEYKGAHIAYSLGNFVFDQNFSEDTRNGQVLRVTVRNKKIESVESKEVRFTPTYQPYFVAPVAP